jgi:hypothetical protein
VKALVIFESMYGNTHDVADAIADGMRPQFDVEAHPVSAVTDRMLQEAEVVVVGGPTHVHGLSRPSTRHAAAEAADEPDAGVSLEPDAEGMGLREWFDDDPELPQMGAAFDTRIDAPALVTGRASKGIAKRMRGLDCLLLVPPESFLVSKQNELLPDERTRARDWGARVAAAATRRSAVST